MNCCLNCDNYKSCTPSCSFFPCPMYTATGGIYSGCCSMNGTGICHPSNTGCTAHVAKKLQGQPANQHPNGKQPCAGACNIVGAHLSCSNCLNFNIKNNCCIIGVIMGNIPVPQTTTCMYHSIIKVGGSTSQSSKNGTQGNSCSTCSNPHGINPFMDPDDDETPEIGIEIEEFPTEPEPKNNDNRKDCFWCKGKTVKIDNGFSFYDYCKKCKK